MKNVVLALVALAFLGAPAIACDPAEAAQVKKVLVKVAANDHCYDNAGVQNVQVKQVKVQQVVVQEVPVVVKQVQVKQVHVQDVVQVQKVQNVHVKQVGGASATNVKVQSAGGGNIKVNVNDGRQGFLGRLFNR